MKDIHVDIIDRSAKDPISGRHVWELERENRAWKPCAEHPRVQAKTLPVNTFAVSALVNGVFKTATAERKQDDYSPLPTKDPKIQFLARKTALDFREYSEKGQPFEQLSSASLFLNTVHNCFAGHYPLGIRPEALMYMVLHEVGICVKQNPDEYRDLFTTSAEKKAICVDVNELDIDNPESPWHLGVARIYSQLKEEVPTGVLTWMLPGFTTDDLESSTASMIAIMDAASPYFDYLMRTMCGISSIRLFGEAEDYKKILVACGQLSERFSKHLGMYFQHLLPVLAKIYAQVSEAEPHDNDFWSSIYNHYSGSGTDDMDGWITAFVNYTCFGGNYRPKTEALYDWSANLEMNKGKWGRGIPRDVLPSHLSAVPFQWQYYSDRYDCRLVGGFLGVDDIDGFATPVLSYAVLRDEKSR